MADDKKNKGKYLQIALLVVFFAVTLAVDIFGFSFGGGMFVSKYTNIIITRALGGIFILLLLVEIKPDIFSLKIMPKALVLILPCAIISINNLPIYALITDAATVIQPIGLVMLFLLSCIAVGFFEELLFRGVIFTLLLKKMPHSRKGIFLAVLYSSAIFGLFHIFNIFAGAGVGVTLLQVGYSFLTGGMWAFALIVTRSIWVPIILHAAYNFCGMLIPELGAGTLWDVPTIVFTAVLAVAAGIYILYMMTKVNTQNVFSIINKNKEI